MCVCVGMGQGQLRLEMRGQYFSQEGIRETEGRGRSGIMRV